MYIVKLSAIIVNIIAIVVLLIGLLHDFVLPKNKAVFGYTVAGSMIMYLGFISLVLIYGLIVNPKLYCIVLFLCVIAPFIIGKLVKYETRKYYTAVQIMTYVVSLIVLFLYS